MSDLFFFSPSSPTPSVLSVKGRREQWERERESFCHLITVLYFYYWLFLSGVLTALQGQPECNRKITTLFCPLTNMAHRRRSALLLIVDGASALSGWERTIQKLEARSRCASSRLHVKDPAQNCVCTDGNPKVHKMFLIGFSFVQYWNIQYR